MRIATWNVNGIKARLEHLVDWLRVRQPDVVCLQEIKSEDSSFPTAPLEAEGYGIALHGQKAWNGVAVLSRHPILSIERGLPGEEEMGSRLLTAETAGLRISSVYVPNGKTLDHPDFLRKLKWLERLREHLLNRPAGSQASVVVGDFNVCPAACDSWNAAASEGQIFHTEEERGRIGALLGLGFADAYRHLHPDEPGFSWWDYRDGGFHRGHGLRIDHVLVEAALLPRLMSAEVDRDFRKKREGRTPSDHAPVVVDLSDVTA